MQTFLVSPSFSETAKVLDNKRLGNQRLEAWIILRTNLGITNGWRNHPAVKQWKGYEWALVEYAQAMCEEWTNRGFKDSMYVKFNNLLNEYRNKGLKDNFFVYPKWITNNDLILSHRSNLIRKLPEHYKKFWTGIPDNIPYWWPTKYLT